MLFFAAALLFKIALTAGIVVAASIVVERSGPFIGSLIASLPTAGGATMIILALEHPAAFIAGSAVGSIVSNAICAVFALTYAVVAQRRSLAVSLAAAFGVWFALAFAAHFVEWTATTAMLTNLLVFPPAIVAGARFRTHAAARRRVHFTAADLVWRAGVVTMVVIVVTAASYSIGSFASGLFAFFPGAMSSFLVILHMRLGGQAAASTAAHVQAPLIGLGLSLLVVHVMAEPAGVWWSYLAGLSVGIGWNALLCLLRQRRLRA